MRSCAYAVVASRSYFTGLATLLHSLGRHNGGSDDCATLVVVHHPSIPDTALTGRERDALACLVAPRRTVWHEVDTERLAVWRSVPLPAPSALSSLVKLDLFFLEDPRVDAIAFFDADMLVLRSSRSCGRPCTQGRRGRRRGCCTAAARSSPNAAACARAT